ncbi:MAG: PAS domain S-box protein, partial [Thermoplasmatota archaeon]
MVRPIENISFPHKKVIDVLLVDDDMGFLELEKAFLKKEDDSFQLFTAQSAYEALQRMEEHSFDIIVSDYKMSEIDGLEFLRILREDRSDEIPFIMFTGEGREEVAIKALNLGADRYLQKGGDPRSLYGILSQAVKQEVTHSKTAKKVKELNSLLMSIRNVNQLIVEENDLLTIINKSCETLLETRGYLNIEIALLEDETGNISPVTSSGKHDKAMWEVNLNGEGDAPKCVKDTIKSADTVLIEDPDTHCEGCPYFEEDSSHRTALVPMIHRGETVGLLTACFEPGHIISKKEIELLEEVAADLGFSREKMIADKLLRQREKRLSTILDSIGDAVIVTDKKGKVDFLNPVAEKLTGWDNEEAKGIVLRDVFNIVNNKTREPVKDPVKRVLENGGTVALTNDTVLTSKDGEEYQIADSAAPLIDQNGEVSGVVLVFRDVTEKYDSQKKLKTYSHHLQERVKELDCLYSITKLLEGDRPIDEVLTSAVKVIPEGWQYPETTSARIKYKDEEYVSDNFTECQCSISQDIVIENEVVGNIEVFDLEEENGEPYLEEEYALLSSISNHLTNFLELKKSKLDIKKSRDFYLTILDDFPALIWRSGIDGMCNYFNSTWLDFTGKSIEDELGEGWTEGVDPDDLDRCVNTYLNAFEKREPFEMEYRLLHHSGEYRWIIDFGRPFWDLEGEFAGYIGSCYDIDDRKKMETELRYRLNLESIIAQASSEMVHLSNDEIDGAIDRTLGLIGNFVGIDRSYVFLFDEEDGVINNT